MAGFVQTLGRGARHRPRTTLALRFSEPARTALGLAMLVSASVAIGAGVALGGSDLSHQLKYILIAAGGLVAVRIIAAGPLACMMAVAFVSAAGLHQQLAHLGRVSIVPSDIFYVGALLMLALKAIARLESGAPSIRLPRARLGQGAAIAFVIYAGLSIWHVKIAQPAVAGQAMISWIRLVQTVSLAWLVVAVVKNPRDVRLILAAVAAGGVFGAGSMVVDSLSDFGSITSARFGGLVGVNAGGLIGGVLVTIGAFGGLGPRKGYRIGLVIAGVIALLICKSVAGMTGTGLVLAVGLGMRRPVEPVRRIGTLIVALTLIGVIVLGMVHILRPSNAPGSSNFGSSSTLQRAMLGTAGLEIYKQNPVIGAGWRRSQQPEVIGSRDVALAVRKAFPNVKEEFYPDVTPLTVHNTYIQILADLGTVGMLFFLAMLLAIGVATRRLLKRLRLGSPLWDMAWCSALGLLLALVWLNDNPLYGGQIETILIATLVGCLAAIDRISRRAPAAAAR
jgi:O-antigen ligase